MESVADGLGEATSDLEPNSVFLDELNHRPRNENVKYSIVLGTGGPMEETEMTKIREKVRTASDRNRFTRFAASKLNGALDNLDEVVSGRGDGAVSCERGRLNGVKDVAQFPFSHSGILNPNAEGSNAAFAFIASRLNWPL